MNQVFYAQPMEESIIGKEIYEVVRRVGKNGEFEKTPYRNLTKAEAEGTAKKLNEDRREVPSEKVKSDNSDQSYNKTSKTLYVIGNGFDRAHLMPVCYACFRNYLEGNKGKRSECDICMYRTKDSCNRKECYLLSLLTTAIEDKKNWSDFEESLAKMDFRVLNIYSDFQFNKLIDNFGECLQEAFHSWVDNITIPPKDCRIFDIDTKSYYLSFNYTMTLEEMYNVASSNIYHVHSSFKEKQCSGRKYVIGHSSTDQQILKNMESQIQDQDQHVVDDWSIALGRLRKESLSESHYVQDFLQKMKIIPSQIKIIGHSFGRVDFDYFEVIRSLFPNAQWTYYYHDTKALCEALNNINQFKREKGNIDMSYEQLSTINIINE